MKPALAGRHGEEVGTRSTETAISNVRSVEKTPVSCAFAIWPVLKDSQTVPPGQIRIALFSGLIFCRSSLPSIAVDCPQSGTQVVVAH